MSRESRTLYLKPKTQKQLRELAQAADTSMSAIICELVDEAYTKSATPATTQPSEPEPIKEE